jgi:hypothetical protein
VIQPRLVLCSGADATGRGALARGRKVVHLDTISHRGNTYLKLVNLSYAFEKQLPSRLVDLLEIATYVYTADCEASRERAWMDDKATEPWSRDFRFVVPVRDSDFWRQPEIADSLTSTLSFLSSDVFDFRFEPLRKERPATPYLGMTDVEDSQFYGIDRVTMFSGGLDSLAGAVETTAAGAKLVAVSHRPAPQINTRQKNLFRLLKQRYGAQALHVPVWVNKHGFDEESTQRTRSFLFASLGATVAGVLQAGGIRFYENGIMSLNWPLAQDVLRSRASRSTHPESLQRLEAFLQLVLERPGFAVDNPFVFRTKTEVVSSIVQHGAGDLLRHTCSCIHTMFQPKTQWHCGRCGQCIDRRMAMLASRQAELDTGDDYVADVFTSPRKPGYDHSVAANYARFASELHGMSVAEVAAAYNPELIRAARCFDDIGETAQQFIEIHKRHAEAVCAVLQEQVAVHSAEFVRGTIDRSSLLGMVGRQEHTGKVAEPPQALPAQAEPVSAPGSPMVAGDQNVFVKRGRRWTVAFDGYGPFDFGDLRGFRVTQYLLKHKREKVSALTLAVVAEGRLPSTAEIPFGEVASSDSDEAADSPEEAAIMEPGFGGREDRLDPTELRDIKQRLRLAKQRMADANRRGDQAQVASASQEASGLKAILDRDTDARGRSRPVEDEIEHARKSVSHNIAYALNIIRGECDPLWRHLDASIRKGYDFTYAPSPDRNWVTD